MSQEKSLKKGKLLFLLCLVERLTRLPVKKKTCRHKTYLGIKMLI